MAKITTTWFGKDGQSLIEYVVLVGAVILAVSLAASKIYQRFAEHASRIEQKNIVF